MTPTSKPAVTPEMLEKARQFYAQDVGVGAANYATEVGRLEGRVRYRIELMARFASSAVQDAVSELEPHLDHLWYCHVHLSEEKSCNCGLAALREKYGVKPRGGDNGNSFAE